MQAQQGAPLTLLTSHNVNKGEDDGRINFLKVSQPDFSISTKRNKMENSTTSCAAGDRFALSSLPGNNLQNQYLGVGPKIIITCHITKMIKTLPNIQHCDHLHHHHHHHHHHSSGDVIMRTIALAAGCSTPSWRFLKS